MEIELKYLIPDQSVIEKMWDDSVLKKYGDVDRPETTEMEAVYYDTKDNVLSGVDVAFRIRREGSHTVATLKWGGRQNEGLHEREELNITLDDSYSGEASLKVFAESDKGCELIDLVGDKPLVPVIRMEFTRDTRRMDTRKAICEMALDRGWIKTENGNEEICELEVELFTGDVESMKSLGEAMVKKFGLEAEGRSKYARGLALLGR